MQVKTTLTLIAAAVALMAGQAFAQGAPKTDRAAVKAEAASANKSGDIKSGEAAGKEPAKMAKSAKPRADVKKEAAAANKAGDTAAGEAAGKEPAKMAKSDKPRADVKKEAAAANKAGETKGGEAGPTPKKP